MNQTENFIIAKGKVITRQVKYCKYNSATRKYDVDFEGGKRFSYNYKNLDWMRNPTKIDMSSYMATYHGELLSGASGIYCFTSHEGVRYCYVEFATRKGFSCKYSELEFEEVIAGGAKSNSVFEYLKDVARLLGLKTDDGEMILAKEYAKIEHVGSNSALAAYLQGGDYCEAGKVGSDFIIYPFGCNASQKRAVKNALDHKISVIEGPPGTGKTQTILNILANLLIRGESAEVVSNNNAATLNVLEKLASEKYGLDFLVAPLGRRSNKELFVASQTGLIPDISGWLDKDFDEESTKREIMRLSSSTSRVFKLQREIAGKEQELSALKVERSNYVKYNMKPKSGAVRLRDRTKSAQVLELLNMLQSSLEGGASLRLWDKIIARFLYGIGTWGFYRQGPKEMIDALSRCFYEIKEAELNSEVKSSERELKILGAQQLLDKLAHRSLYYLRNIIARRYESGAKRMVFSEADLFRNGKTVLREYPIILSSTYSSRSSLNPQLMFDYVIMDEASQVDIATGALSMSGAKNAVIVGDRQQLPNIVTRANKEIADKIRWSYEIPESYDYCSNSFLKSICDSVNGIPNTLLREHYRCHPKIINFCNQKFYGGRLVIMTKDHGEKDALSLIKTVEGNHKRGLYNQRQIDVVAKEVLPNIDIPDKEIGIIAPYNQQVNNLRAQLGRPDITVATVHKFQGREKRCIVMTTVDDEVTDFTDDPYLLNVAVSRAQEKFCLVASSGIQAADSNIADLMQYIEYTNCEVRKSALHSVFDYLYSSYSDARRSYLKKHSRVSEYDSENLMMALIEEVFSEGKYSQLGVIAHQPLGALLRDTARLNDAELKYATNPATHLDFLIYNKISKRPLLAIEVDGYRYHKEGTRQHERDTLKNNVLQKYHLPLIRFATNGSNEKALLAEQLAKIMQ